MTDIFMNFIMISRMILIAQCLCFNRGILSVAWCQRDPDLLLSCGKDNRILCWNPNSNVQTGEVRSFMFC